MSPLEAGWSTWIYRQAARVAARLIARYLQPGEPSLCQLMSPLTGGAYCKSRLPDFSATPSNPAWRQARRLVPISSRYCMPISVD